MSEAITPVVTHSTALCDLLVTQTDLASVFGCDQSEVSRLTSMGVLVRVSGQVGGRNRAGRYRLGEAVRAWQIYKTRRGPSGESDEEMARAMAKARLEKAQQDALLARLKAEEKMSNLVEVEPVLEFLSELLIRMRESLLQLPEKLAPLCVRQDQKRIASTFREAMTEILNELSRIGPDLIRQVAAEYEDEEVEEEETPAGQDPAADVKGLPDGDGNGTEES